MCKCTQYAKKILFKIIGHLIQKFTRSLKVGGANTIEYGFGKLCFERLQSLQHLFGGMSQVNHLLPLVIAIRDT